MNIKHMLIHVNPWDLLSSTLKEMICKTELWLFRCKSELTKQTFGLLLIHLRHVSIWFTPQTGTVGGEPLAAKEALVLH